MASLILSGQSRMILKSKIPAPAELEPYRRRDGSYSFPICGDIVRRLMAAFPNINIDDDLREELRGVAQWQREALALAGRDDFDLPYTDLYPYQRVAVAWLSFVQRGILADEQGLGKTVMAVTAAREVSPRKALIICSNSKRGDWLDHVQQWIPGAQAQILEGDKAQRLEILKSWEGYLVCNYKIASIHSRDIKGADLVIVDEAHKMRNKDTDTFQAVRRISKPAKHLYLVTASPTVNMAGDIWTLLHLCDPKRFSSYWGFIFRFCEVTDDGYGLKVGGIRDGERENLERMISPYMLMRDGMLGLPDPTYRVVEFTLDGIQQYLYEELDEEGKAEYGDQTVRALTDLSLITRLRQVALHPGLIFEGYKGPSKLDVLESIVRERDGKVVMFTHYASLAHMAAIELCERGIDAVCYTGDMSNGDRAYHLDEFRNGNAQVIVLTHGVGGEGLDLVEADRAVFLELAWHPAGNKHALRRILRHGQSSEEVEIILVQVPDSIEDHIRDIVNDKERVTIEEIMRRRRQ